MGARRPPGRKLGLIRIVLRFERRRNRQRRVPARAEAIDLPSGPHAPNIRSTGLRTAPGPRFRTCVQIIAVLTSRCPSNSCTVRMSYPSSSRWVANEWRKVWQVVAPPPAGRPVDVDPCRREDPLPSPLSAGARVLSYQRPWELDPAGAFQNAQPCSLPEQGHEPRDGSEPVEDGSNLVAGQHHGQSPWADRAMGAKAVCAVSSARDLWGCGARNPCITKVSLLGQAAAPTGARSPC